MSGDVAMNICVIGIYAVEALEPCHLVELEFDDFAGPIDFMGFTQEVAGQPQDNWQVPWDERFLDVLGEHELNSANPAAQPTAGHFRVTFFFHYLDIVKPLLSPVGPLQLPPPAPRPARLAFIQYDSPC